MLSKFTTYRPCLLAAASFAALSCSSTAWADASPDCVDVPVAPESTECGSNSFVDVGSNLSSAIGTDTFATGRSATAVGSHAVSYAPDTDIQFSTVDNPPPFEDGATSLGTYAYALGTGTLAVGDQAVVGRSVPTPGETIYDLVNLGTAVGSHTSVTGDFSTAMGATASATFGTAIGAAASVTVSDIDTISDYAVAIGNGANADNVGAVAVGAGAGALHPNGAYSVAVGGSSRASGDNSIAIGGADSFGDAGTEALAAGAIAIGSAAKSTGVDGIAIGSGSQASADNSVAVGAGSVADEDNTVSVGAAGAERRIVNVAAGTADNDAVNVSQLNAVTSDVSAVKTTVATHTTQITAVQAVNTTQATQITALQAVDADLGTRIDALEAATSQIDTLFDLRSRDRRDMKQGVAAAMSMAQAPMPSGPGRVSYAVNGATFRGEYAVGASLNYRLNTEAPFAVSVGASFAGNKNNGFRLGVAGEF